MLLGLLSRRERWGLSLRGWILLFALGAASTLLLARTIHPFFAVTQRCDADFLAVEGWVHGYALRAAKDEFDSGRYRFIVATGGPVQGVGAYRNDYSTAASIGATGLRHAGMPADRVHMAPSRINARDRTYNAAVALRDWFRERQISVHALNVVTEDVHARRTRLLFQAAFGRDVEIGIIAVPNPDYDAARWWRYSEGVRDVLGETISYVYAKFFFFPPAAPSAEPSASPAS